MMESKWYIINPKSLYQILEYIHLHTHTHKTHTDIHAHTHMHILLMDVGREFQIP